MRADSASVRDECDALSVLPDSPPTQGHASNETTLASRNSVMLATTARVRGE